MVRDSVFVRFGPTRADQELIPLGSLAPVNPGVIPADPEEWQASSGASQHQDT